MRTILRIGRHGVTGLCVLALAGCASSAGSGGAQPATGTTGAECPVSPVPVVVTVDQWGDIVDQLAASCGRVTTIFKSTAADPHDYEPTPSDVAQFEDAALVVENGLDYDPWADKAVDALGVHPVVVNAGEVVGRRNGDNPHIWYGPDYVSEVADAVTAALQRLEPDAATVFERASRAWKEAMRPYRAEIDRIKPHAAGKSYGATEGIFDDMAAAFGMRNATPAGYQRAAANETEPSPGDLHAFEQALANGSMSVLIFNTQTEGAVTDQLRQQAEDAHVPVVDVTESVPPSYDSFVSWQVGQLRSLATALGA
jgi:zinc/manganese transport system substrate-binding protein